MSTFRFLDALRHRLQDRPTQHWRSQRKLVTVPEGPFWKIAFLLGALQKVLVIACASLLVQGVSKASLFNHLIGDSLEILFWQNSGSTKQQIITPIPKVLYLAENLHHEVIFDLHSLVSCLGCEQMTAVGQNFANDWCSAILD